MSLQERLTQCQADKAAIKANELELLDQIKAEKAEKAETYKIGDIFWRNETCDNGHYVRLASKCGQVGLLNFLGELLIPTYNNSMNGYFAVEDINAITMAEVRRMTSYPAGLRLVSPGRLVITEK